jgi:hypothetical protein
MTMFDLVQVFYRKPNGLTRKMELHDADDTVVEAVCAGLRGLGYNLTIYNVPQRGELLAKDDEEVLRGA